MDPSFDAPKAGSPTRHLSMCCRSWQCALGQSSPSCSLLYAHVLFGGPYTQLDYGISGTWAVNFFWFSVFISWIIKWCILRFGGLKTFRSLAPFFLGLILGEFLVGGVWALIGVVLEKPMYRFIW